jgi:hypothetical protein
MATAEEGDAQLPASMYAHGSKGVSLLWQQEQQPGQYQPRRQQSRHIWTASKAS